MLDKLEALVEEKRNPAGPYTTERGIVLKYYKVSADLVRKAHSAVQVPQPPMVFIESRGRQEPNPHDPGYLHALNSYTNDSQLAIHTIYLMRGVEIASLPDDVPGPDSNEWFEGIEDIIGGVPVGKIARKTAWLLYYALNDTEKDEIIEDLMKFSGLITEEKVQQAIDSFRSNGVEQTDQQVSTETGDTD